MLARATGNQTLARLVESMRDLLKATGHVLHKREGGSSLEAHCALAYAILSRDALLAESLMRRHLEDISDRLRVARGAGASARQSS